MIENKRQQKKVMHKQTSTIGLHFQGCCLYIIRKTTLKNKPNLCLLVQVISVYSVSLNIRVLELNYLSQLFSHNIQRLRSQTHTAHCTIKCTCLLIHLLHEKCSRSLCFCFHFRVSMNNSACVCLFIAHFLYDMHSVYVFIISGFSWPNSCKKSGYY